MRGGKWRKWVMGVKRFNKNVSWESANICCTSHSKYTRHWDEGAIVWFNPPNISAKYPLPQDFKEVETDWKVKSPASDYTARKGWIGTEARPIWSSSLQTALPWQSYGAIMAMATVTSACAFRTSVDTQAPLQSGQVGPRCPRDPHCSVNVRGESRRIQ